MHFHHIHILHRLQIPSGAIVGTKPCKPATYTKGSSTSAGVLIRSYLPFVLFHISALHLSRNCQHYHCHPRWEKLLPEKFIVAAMEENPTSLKLKVEIKTMDMVEKKSITSLVDCGATREFIDQHYTKSNCQPCQALSTNTCVQCWWHS